MAAPTALFQSENRLSLNRPFEWVETHAPAANTQATKVRSAPGTSRKHVVTSISAAFVAGAVAPTAVAVQVNLKDDTTVIWSRALALPATAGAAVGVDLSNLNIEISDNKSVTLEFSAAGGANTIESVAFTGYTRASTTG